MKRSVQYCLLITFCLCCNCEQAISGWKLLRQFDAPIGCGYFFDPDNGLIGSGLFDANSTSGQFLGSDPLRIFWTSDGGTNWNQAVTPDGTGRVTSIFMKDANEGYASIYSQDYSLWKTTDAGKTWFDFSQGNNDLSTCVYATSKSITKTIWFGNSGGSSFDNGFSYSHKFRGARNGNGSNGIDFSDDNNGVVSMGPGGQSWITNNGGVTWTQGDNLPESWSVYAMKGTQTFFALPEDGNSTGQILYWTQNDGRNWSQRFTFGDPSFTGHIAGNANTLYVQSESIFNNAHSGLYRSDDLGLTWNNVGGPSNTRDSRFVVTGCIGQVVYAFDDQGEVWKTTDGGDGTLIASGGGGSLLAFLQDSIYIETRYCQPIRWYVNLVNMTCKDSLFLDAVTVTPNPYGEFSVDTILNNTKLSPSSSLGVPITFHSDSNVTRHAILHILAHSGSRTVDTTIILNTKHSTAPEPYLDSLLKTKVGDTVLVPVFIRATKDTFTITHFSLHLSYDGDILTPASAQYETRGTLSAISTVTLGSPEPSGILVTVDLPKPITQDSDLTKPLIYLRMGVTLSRYMSCPVRMDTFAISNTAPLPLCSIPETMFTVDPQCGEISISAFMLDGTMPKLFSVHPNPNSGGEVEAEISLPQEVAVTVELVDAMGKIVRNVFEGKQFQKGEYPLRINNRQLANGSYILRMRTSDGHVSQQGIVILH